MRSTQFHAPRRAKIGPSVSRSANRKGDLRKIPKHLFVHGCKPGSQVGSERDKFTVVRGAIAFARELQHSIGINFMLIGVQQGLCLTLYRIRLVESQRASSRKSGQDVTKLASP